MFLGGSYLYVRRGKRAKELVAIAQWIQARWAKGDPGPLFGTEGGARQSERSSRKRTGRFVYFMWRAAPEQKLKTGPEGRVSSGNGRGGH